MRRGRTAIHVVGWLIVAPLGAFVVARFLAPDSRSILIALNAATALVLLPAWIVAVIAALLRFRLLLAVALVLVVAHIALLWPELSARKDVSRAARSAPRIVVFDANVLAGNHDVESIGSELRRARADVVTLEEASPEFVAGLDAASALGSYPYRFQVPRTDPFAFAIASRFPLRDTAIVSDGDRPLVVETTLETPGRMVRLFVVHTTAPFGAGRARWQRDLGLIRREVRKEHAQALLVVGDFNATWGNHGFRTLLSDGFTDAAAARGHPFQMTWPRDRRLTPPLIRIDHALTRGALSPLETRVGVGRGSDHRPLIVTVAML